MFILSLPIFWTFFFGIPISDSVHSTNVLTSIPFITGAIFIPTSRHPSFARFGIDSSSHYLHVHYFETIDFSCFLSNDYADPGHDGVQFSKQQRRVGQCTHNLARGMPSFNQTDFAGNFAASRNIVKPGQWTCAQAGEARA